jgi:hypothetical protein
VTLTGERRIGKTSFLHHLKKALDAQRGALGFVPVFVDLEAASPRPSRALVEETVETLGLQPSALGLRLDGRHDGYSVRDLVHDLKRVVRDLRERTRADAKLVFLVDEVEAVLKDAAWDGEAWLDALLHECSEELRVVVAGVTPRGSVPGEPRREQCRLEDLVLEPLGSEDARELVTRPVARRFGYEPGAVDRIVQLAHGRPYVLQRICLNALNRMLDEERTIVRLADVEAVAALAAFKLARPPRPEVLGAKENA